MELSIISVKILADAQTISLERHKNTKKNIYLTLPGEFSFRNNNKLFNLCNTAAYARTSYEQKYFILKVCPTRVIPYHFYI